MKFHSFWKLSKGGGYFFPIACKHTHHDVPMTLSGNRSGPYPSSVSLEPLIQGCKIPLLDPALTSLLITFCSRERL